MDYLRQKSPERLYREGKRSWNERKLETDQDLFVANIAAEIVEAFTDEALESLRDPGIVAIAERLYSEQDQILTQETMSDTQISIGSASESSFDDSGDLLRTAQHQQIRQLASDFVDNLSEDTLREAYIDIKVGDGELFNRINEETLEEADLTAEELLEERKERVLGDRKIIRDDWMETNELQKERLQKSLGPLEGILGNIENDHNKTSSDSIPDAVRTTNTNSTPVPVSLSTTSQSSTSSGQRQSTRFEDGSPLDPHGYTSSTE